MPLVPVGSDLCKDGTPHPTKKAVATATALSNLILLSFRGDAKASNPESRDSGFVASRRPGMTAE
jgi:hypothetical protein